MRLETLTIRNLRAVEELHIETNGQGVVIAGPNGCGKSSVLDAIRVLKSSMGGYDPQEYQQWWGEMGINTRRPGAGTSVLRDKSREGLIHGVFTLSSSEKEFLKSDDRMEVVEELAWRFVLPGLSEWQLRWQGILTPEMLQKRTEVLQMAKNLDLRIQEELTKDELVGKFWIDSFGRIHATSDVTLQLICSSYVPGKLGVIDYHGSQRVYAREELNQISLNEDDEEDRRRTSSLYNWGGKYQNLKNAMASEFVRDTLKQSSIANTERLDSRQTMISGMTELVGQFLQGKQFDGPVVDKNGRIIFPIKTLDGAEHDINDLSSGEKEVVFGYLRARTITPRNSIILVDEPELHLNPALIQGLPRFYQEQMGEHRENQLWLVTHSDAFLREAVETSGMDVHHMRSATKGRLGNQLRRIDHRNDVDRLCIELVGDLAAYRPGEKIIILEGASRGTDVQIVDKLFPDIRKEATIVGGGSRRNVRELRDILNELAAKGEDPQRVWAITDEDADESEEEGLRTKKQLLKWDRYHIENYLLEEKYLLAALEALELEEASTSGRVAGLRTEIKHVCIEMARDFAVEKVTRRLNKKIRRIGFIDIKDLDDRAHESLAKRAEERVRKIQQTIESEATADRIEAEIQEEESRLRKSVSSSNWKRFFRGRDVLKRLCAARAGNLRYETLRNVIVNEMARDGFRPTGMKKTLDRDTRPRVLMVPNPCWLIQFRDGRGSGCHSQTQPAVERVRMVGFALSAGHAEERRWAS